MLKKRTETAIIGGGLQGVSIAMELAARGHSVTLIEQDGCLINRASRRNEGKIHLGLIYAGDETMRTAFTQLKGAFSFFPLLQRWLGARTDDIGLSTPFCYLVAEDSLKSPELLLAHYDRLSEAAAQLMKNDSRLAYPNYANGRMAAPARFDNARWFAKNKSAAVFDTPEISINTDALAAVMNAAVKENPFIEILCGKRCELIERRSDGLYAEGISNDGGWSIIADRICNCSWEGRLRLDAMMGLPPHPGWLHRLKYRLIAQLPEAMRAAPSATIVLGPYGDIVIRDDGSAYLSWYPTGCKGWSHDLEPPRDWQGPSKGEADPKIARSIAKDALHHLGEWCPAICEAIPKYVDAGAILAYGKTDVDDPDSELHDRTRIGVFAQDNYFSVDPGKLTTAPLFAIAAADAMTGKRADMGFSNLAALR